MATDIEIYKPSFIQRISGILFFNSYIYRHVATNENLTLEATIIVFLVMLINSMFRILQQGFHWNILVIFFSGILISWLFISWLVAWIVNKFFKKQIPASFVIRARAYAMIYNLLFLALNFISPSTSLFTLLIITADILFFVAQTLSIRESCEISTI